VRGSGEGCWVASVDRKNGNGEIEDGEEERAATEEDGRSKV